MTAAAFQPYECYITKSDDKILNEDKIRQRVPVDMLATRAAEPKKEIKINQQRGKKILIKNVCIHCALRKIFFIIFHFQQILNIFGPLPPCGVKRDSWIED